ncbi:Dbl homology domain-containing protein [Marasmius fiardii PR-910]|nr:Dbl homology domain-containing protein [Marasmius fiardii PR-910]
MGLRERHVLKLTTPSSTSTVALPPQPPLSPSVEAVVFKKLSPNSSRNTARRPTISGFLPLSPISASPICSPTTSTSSHNFSFFDDQGRSAFLKSTESFATAPTTPSDSSVRALTVPSPTWISTPPTPPPKVIKRSVTCMPHSLTSSITPYPSFSASRPPHARPRSSESLQRCASTSSLPSDSSSIPPTPHRSRPDSMSTTSSPTFYHVSQPHKSNPCLLAASRQVKFPRSHPPNVTTDHYDPEHEQEDREKKLDCEQSVESASSEDSVRERLLRENAKDCDRKYHALIELLSTEVSYLQDLRILVSVYLRNVPTLTRIPSTGAFSINSSFSALSRNNSYTQLSIGMSGPGTFGLDFHGHGLQPMTSIHPPTKDKEKSPTRHLFTDMEVEMLTRNAEEVLHFHERFVDELRLSMSSLGIPLELAEHHNMSEGSYSESCRAGIENVDAGIAMLSTKFAIESSRFNVYQTFCAGHPEALDVLRRVQQLYPVEWDSFEQRCGDAISEQRFGHDHPPPESTDMDLITSKKQRRMSIPTVDQTVRTLTGRTSTQSIAFPKDTQTDPKRPRLFFMDYLIKPVQRICKYPLLLDQLKTGRSPPTIGLADINVVVESAALAMRHVAGEVDEACRKQDVAARSLLIISRTSIAPTKSSSVSPQPLQALTSSFLSSLGTCLFAGSLDVIHNRSTKYSPNMTSINAKYLGAFLYAGGYLILVKVLKGKIYEPRHWFKLTEFQISDPGETEAWLPCSFRLCRQDSDFELAAPCQAEKDSWMSMIRESLSCSVPTWINEPLSSIQLDRNRGSDGFEAIDPLPTIQSVSELSKGDDSETVPLIERGSEGSPTKSKISKIDNTLPSRQSSLASVRSILSPAVIDSDTIIIRRCLPAARAQIELGLQDVTSEQCFTARSHATVHEGGLFQAPHISRSGTSRSSSSALSMKKLKRHESVRVDRRNFNEDIKYKSKSLSRANRKRPKTLSLSSITSDGTDSLASHRYYEPSPPFSQDSYTSSNPTSHDNSPVHDISFLPNPASSGQPEPYKRAHRHSLVGSVRSLFLAKSPAGVEEDPLRKRSSPSILRRWVKGSHWRTNSAPNNLEPTQGSSVLPQVQRSRPLTPSSDCSRSRLERLLASPS